MMGFAPRITESQLPGHCGPCSLSTCLYILGIEATQRELAHAAGAPFRVFMHGIDENKIKKAANAYGVKCSFVMVKSKLGFDKFASKLLAHLEKGLPAILCVWDFSHWIAVIGYLKEKEKFIIVDPRNKNSIYNLYSKNYLAKIAWNELEEDGNQNKHSEPAQYFCILLSRKDRKPPRWLINEAWLRLCERGSDDTADNMANDLLEMAQRASPQGKNGGNGYYMTQILDQYEDLILDTVSHWVGNSAVSKNDLRSFYEDYKVVAASTAIRLAKNADTMALISQISTLLTIYACLGRV